MKRTLFGSGATALLLLAHLLQASAQTYFPPDKPDHDALTAPAQVAQKGVRNTGTDVLLIAGTNERLQAVVWDNDRGEVTLSTVLNTGNSQAGTSPYAFVIDLPTAPTAYTSVSDPDVALAYYGGDIYANVVYLASEGVAPNVHTRAFLDTYRWDAGAQHFNLNPIARNALGVKSIPNLTGFNGPNPIPRLHSSPNIDANDGGTLGIVWQEKSTETAQITVLSPSYSASSTPAYPNGYTYISEGLAFAESYLLTALADGSLRNSGNGCNGWRGYLISALRPYDPNPTPASNNPPILANQTLLPDVAVSSGNKLWVSYLVSAAVQGEPPVRAGLNLVLSKVNYECGLYVSLSQSWQDGVTLNPPRLAASPARYDGDDSRDEAEVVQAWQGSPCEEGYGARRYFEVRNWGHSNGDFRPQYNLVSQVTVIGTNGRPSTEPVVSYYGGNDPTNADGDYVVAWTGDNYPEYGNERDVWSRSLNAGVPLTPDYSRVNYASPDNKRPLGNQCAPSVAARCSFEKFGAAFAWADAATATVRYRYTIANPASGGPFNRPAAPGSTGGTGSAAPARTLEAFPNPFGGNVEFRVSLHPGEAVQSSVLTDLSGRVLATVPTPAGASTEAVAKI